MKIGLGITTRNRNEILEKCLQEHNRFLPEGARLVVVDDASDVPVKEADYRFEVSVGVATAKNKCFDLLQDCKHIFLFDNDIYPIHKDWYKPYIEHTEPHLQYIFTNTICKAHKDIILEHEDDYTKAYSGGRGCMLYFNNLQERFDETFKFGFEHAELSQRIYKKGYTKYPFMDVKKSNNLLHSMDEHCEVSSTLSPKERLREVIKNRKYYVDIVSK